MKYIRFFLILFLLYHPVSASGIEVTATGFGVDAESARYDAMRKAVEMGLGVLVDSQSVSKNQMLIHDKIFTTARGYVQHYTTVSEHQMQGGDWKAVLNCTVAEESLELTLKALNILIRKMDKPRIRVVLDSPFTNQWQAKNSPAVSEAHEGIIEYLTERQFPLLDDQPVNPGTGKKAEFQLRYTLEKSREKFTGTFNTVWIMISVKIINTASSQVIANLTQKAMGRDKDSPLFALNKAARKGGILAAKFLEKKIVERWKRDTVTGRPVYIHLNNVRNFALLSRFRRKLNKIYGVNNINLRNSTHKTAQFEFTYTGLVDHLKESAYAILTQQMGLKLKLPVSHGDMIRFDVK